MVPGESATQNQIFDRLRRANPGLCTNRWIVMSSFTRGPGRFLVVSMDEPSIEFLRGIGNRPFYLLGRASIWLHGGK